MQGIIAIVLLFIQISGPSSLDTNNESDFLHCATTIGGDFKVFADDTVEEDVTVKGGNAEIDGVVEGDLAVMGGEIDVNGMIDGDVAVFGGDLDILGKITGDAAVFGGNIHNKGTIGGDLFVVGGAVSLDSGSVVGGDISTVGGSVDRDENASVGGKIESLELGKLSKLLPRVTKALKWHERFPGVKAFTGLFSISVLIVIYVLSLLVLLIFPGAIDRIVNKIRGSVWISVASGIGIEILFVPLIVLFAVSIIGIPIIPLFVLAVLVAMLFGFSASSVTIGDRVKNSLKWQVNNRVAIFSLGWIVIMVIPILGLYLRGLGFVGTLIFVLGLAILYVTMTIGLGAIIYALIKREK